MMRRGRGASLKRCKSIYRRKGGTLGWEGKLIQSNRGWQRASVPSLHGCKSINGRRDGKLSKM